MKPRYLVNLALLVLIIGLFWLTKQSVETISSPLTTIDSGQIHQIKIIRKNNKDIFLEKQEDSSWQLTAPSQAKANDIRVALLLNVLSIEPANQFQIESVDDLKKFGLEPADLTLFLNDHEFQFGTFEPISEHRYMRYQQTIYLFDDPITPLLRANVDSFLDTHLFSQNEQIQSLQIAGIDDKKAIPLNINKKDGYWQSNNEKLGTDELARIVAHWQKAYAQRVSTIPYNDFDKSIHLQFGSTADPIEIKFYETASEIILYRADQTIQYHFPVNMKQQFFPDMDKHK